MGLGPGQEGDAILDFPARNLRSLATVPADVTRQLGPRVSVQSLLAVDLCLRSETDALHAAWKALLPSAADVRAALPFFWPAALQDGLPAAARALLGTQRDKVAREWAQVRRVFPHLDRESYACAWFTVSTRTFYWEAPELEGYEWADHLALVPIADFFNHAGEEAGAAVAFSSAGYTISAKRGFKAGEEICISYGDHSNDFLLAEYGFLLPDNRSDKIFLDDIIIPKLSQSQEARLRASDLWQGYSVTSDGRSDRTDAMLALLCPKQHMLRRGGRRRVGDDATEEDTDRETPDSFFAALIGDFPATIRNTIACIEALQVGEASQRSLLRTRWAQIERLVLGSLGRRTESPSP